MNLKGKQSKKQHLQVHLAKAYNNAKSEEHFYALLQNEGLKLYFRGQHTGIMDGSRKYRLQTLGYSLERIQLLSLDRNKRTEELNRILSKKLSDREQNNELEP
jgi:hypothetical protein